MQDCLKHLQADVTTLPFQSQPWLICNLFITSPSLSVCVNIHSSIWAFMILRQGGRCTSIFIRPLAKHRVDSTQRWFVPLHTAAPTVSVCFWKMDLIWRPRTMCVLWKPKVSVCAHLTYCLQYRFGCPFICRFILALHWRSSAIVFANSWSNFVFHFHHVGGYLPGWRHGGRVTFVCLTQEHNTSIIHAASGCHLDCVRLLVESGADKDAKNEVRHPFSFYAYSFDSVFVRV